MKNKYGLPRDIPADVQREVRQRCGFGCVICGASIIEYEHVDPPFAEAKEHNPELITLLCPQCHSKVTRGFLSKQTVKEAMKHPICKRIGYASEVLDVGKTHPKVVFAGATLICAIPIQVKGIPLFEIAEAEEPGGPFRLWAIFLNSRGEISLQIVDNEWRAYESNWDVEATGSVISVRDAPGKISLQMVARPPDELIIDRLDMYLGGFHFLGDRGTLTMIQPNGSRMTLTKCLFSGAHIGIAIG